MRRRRACSPPTGRSAGSSTSTCARACATAAAPRAFQRLDDGLYPRLQQWITRWYREELAPADLVDPHLLDESRHALDQLTAILNLGSDFYPFQRA
jgi:succinylarginine dihydrolase